MLTESFAPLNTPVIGVVPLVVLHRVIDTVSVPVTVLQLVVIPPMPQMLTLVAVSPGLVAAFVEPR